MHALSRDIGMKSPRNRIVLLAYNAQLWWGRERLVIVVVVVVISIFIVGLRTNTRARGCEEIGESMPLKPLELH